MGSPSNPENEEGGMSSSKWGIFSKDFTVEDLILYVFCFSLGTFLAVYFWNLNSGKESWEKDVETYSVHQLDRDFQGEDKIMIEYFTAQMYLVARRYDYAEISAKSTFRLKHIAFMIGALLTILGAIVVIKGVRGSSIELAASAKEHADLKFKTSSPGVFIALIGAIVMTITVIKGTEVNYSDEGIFYPGSSSVQDRYIPGTENADTTQKDSLPERYIPG